MRWGEKKGGSRQRGRTGIGERKRAFVRAKMRAAKYPRGISLGIKKDKTLLGEPSEGAKGKERQNALRLKRKSGSPFRSRKEEERAPELKNTKNLQSKEPPSTTSVNRYR